MKLIWTNLIKGRDLLRILRKRSFVTLSNRTIVVPCFGRFVLKQGTNDTTPGWMYVNPNKFYSVIA